MVRHLPDYIRTEVADNQGRECKMQARNKRLRAENHSYAPSSATNQPRRQQEIENTPTPKEIKKNAETIASNTDNEGAYV
jgi:hypothetical protein